MKRFGRALALAVAVVAAGCGGGDGNGDSELTVSAAASLTDAFESYGEATPGVERFSFAGSDELAAQIRQGARPDVFAAANTKLPERLHDEGLVAKPVVFARNELVLAVPAPGSTLRSIDRLIAPRLDLVIGSDDVPVGAYTQEVLSRLSRGRRDAILANVRSKEPDVKGVVGKLATGAADAGFVYASDVTAAGGKLRAIKLPRELGPQVLYAAAIVTGAPEPAAARSFIDGLLQGGGAAALAEQGFLPPRDR